MSAINLSAVSNVAAAANNSGSVPDVSVVENSDFSRLDELTRAKIGSSMCVDFIPSWDKGRIEEGCVISFVDDPMAENDRIKSLAGLLGALSLLCWLCAQILRRLFQYLR